MKAHIVTLPGDGIGPEITAAAVEVLQAVAARFGHTFRFSSRPVAGQAIDGVGRALPAEPLAACEQADAVLLGAVGGPKWDSPQAAERPEQGLLQLRAALGVHTNLRPIRVHPALAGLSPLKNDRLEKDRKSTRLNSSHVAISYAVFCLRQKRRVLNYDSYAHDSHSHTADTADAT